MADKKHTVTFTAAVEVLDHNNKVEFSAKEGESKDLSAASAARWIKRGKAVEGKIKKTKAPAKEGDKKTEK